MLPAVYRSWILLIGLLSCDADSGTRIAALETRVADLETTLASRESEYAVLSEHFDNLVEQVRAVQKSDMQTQEMLGLTRNELAELREQIAGGTKPAGSGATVDPQPGGPRGR